MRKLLFYNILSVCIPMLIILLFVCSINTPYKVVNIDNSKKGKILFCGNYIDSSKIEFIKNYIAALETQNHIYDADSFVVDKSWKVINKNSSAIGRYQFIKRTRKEVANFLGENEPTMDEFIENPELQDRYLLAYFEMNNKIFSDSVLVKIDSGKFVKYPSAYERYENKVINGYLITRSGMLMMSHALGANGTIEFLRNKCKKECLPKGNKDADKRLLIAFF